ncbi:MAG TPA: cobalt ECF transporter T component CbiQ, partial [Anaerolineae bacterium]|nr:cobalt ECF transporter T component CbiQ [Anaerolineae bacterium]
WQLTISDTGLARFVTVMLKSWLSVLAALLLTASTPFPEMLTGLRGIGVPRVLVAIIAFMFRYAFILADEALRLMRAREARSARPSARIHIDGKVGGSLGWRARVTGGMVGNLFVRSFERSERIYNAMLSRGYAGDLRTLQSPALRPWHLAAGGSFLMLLGLVELMARW